MAEEIKKRVGVGGMFRNTFAAMTVSVRLPTYILESGVWHLKVHRRLLLCNEKKVNKKGRKKTKKEGIAGRSVP